MLTPIGNVHHSKLPRLGEIGTIHGLERWFINPRRRCIVESFPLTDSADPRYSRGVHTVTVRFLDNGERRRVSGFYFDDGYGE